jgi:hypothetical protein
VATVALIVSLASAVMTPGIGVWVAFRTRLKVTVTLQTGSAYAVNSQEQVPLAKILVNSQGKALTVENIAFEWVSPMPRPESWGVGTSDCPRVGPSLVGGHPPDRRRDDRADTTRGALLHAGW